LNCRISIPRLPPTVTAGLYALAVFVSRFKYWKSSLFEGHAYFADADCYTRLYRVKRLLAEHALIQRFHPFENFPDGIVVHTTALLDWLVGGLSLFLHLLPLQAVQDHPLDWAGILIGPLLAAGTAFLLYRLLQNHEPAWQRWLFFGSYLINPLLIWSTSMARPDHQNLIISLLLLAWALELRRWEQPGLHAWAGAVWGLALWVSLLEPLLFLAPVLLVNLVVRRREARTFWVTLLLVSLPLLALEGVRSEAYEKLNAPYIHNWMGTIGELRHSTLNWWIQYGGLIFLFPLWLLLRRKELAEPRLLIFLISSVAAGVLVYWQQRWGYFFAGISLFLFLLLLPRPRSVLAAGLLLALQLGPMIWWNWTEYPKITTPEELAQLRDMAEKITPDSGALMGPWWQSPALLYFSGAPIIGSSSHESIEGIVDTARFYTSCNFPEAEALLKKHRVGWVLVYLPDRLYRNSEQILTGKKYDEIEMPSYSGTRLVCRRLFEHVAVPSAFRVTYVSPLFTLYHYQP